MSIIITSNDTSINIKYIDDEESYYQLNIPNNDINKKLIENTVFKFEKSGTQTIIMHDDNNVFHLSKMECSYSDYIVMKEQLEHLKKENDILKQYLSKNEKEMVNFKNDLLQQMKNDMVNFKNELFNTNNSLQKQINSTSYYQPIIFLPFQGGTYEYRGDIQYQYGLSSMLSLHQYGLLNHDKLQQVTNFPCCNNNYKILIPLKKTVILFKKSIEIYSSGIHKNIEGSFFFWCGKEDDKDEFINTLKNIGYNCDNIIYFK
jgi:hypothetical protein